MKSVVYCLYNDGQHLSCFDTEEEAARFIESTYLLNKRYIEVIKEEVDDVTDCDCGGPK